MGKKDGEKKKRRWLHPFRAIGQWLEEDETTSRRGNLLLGALGSLIASAIIFGIGLVVAAVAFVDFDGDVPMWVTIACVVLALGIGLASGAFMVARFYHRPRIEAVEKLHSEAGRGLDDAESELDELKSDLRSAQQQIAGLAVHAEVRAKIESYVEQISLPLSQGLGSGLDDVEKILLVEPARLMQEVTGHQICLSVWKPDVDGTWEVLHSAGHTDRECQSFRLPLNSSWIAWNQKQKAMEGKSSFGVEDLGARTEVMGSDIAVFRNEGFRSLQCTPVATGAPDQEAEDIPCLIALSREPHALTGIEYSYLQFLGRILAIHYRLVDLIEQVENKSS